MRMGAMFWLVVAAAGVGGYLAFRRLQELEDDIRDEIEDRERAGERRGEAPAPSREEAPEAGKAPVPATSLEERIVQAVRDNPGRLQTELYAAFADIDRRRLQATLLSLDRTGRLRRVREQGTYRVFPD